jgi:hypothetical protein
MERVGVRLEVISSFAAFLVFRKYFSSFATFASVLMGIVILANVEKGWLIVGWIEGGKQFSCDDKNCLHSLKCPKPNNSQTKKCWASEKAIIDFHRQHCNSIIYQSSPKLQGFVGYLTSMFVNNPIPIKTVAKTANIAKTARLR